MPIISCYDSWTGDFQAYNLCSVDTVPGMTRRQRAALFSRVAFYPPSVDGDRDLPTPTSMRGIPLVSDETTPLRFEDIHINRESMKKAGSDFMRYLMN